MLKQMHEEDKTEKIVLEAVRENGWEIAWAGRFAESLEVRLAAVQEAGDALGRIPEELRSPEVCEAAVRRSPSALRHVPDELKSKGLCLLACSLDAGAYAWVPEDLREDVYAELHGAALVRLAGRKVKKKFEEPYAWNSEKFCRTMLRRNAGASRWIPEETLAKIAGRQS